VNVIKPFKINHQQRERERKEKKKNNKNIQI